MILLEKLFSKYSKKELEGIFPREYVYELVNYRIHPKLTSIAGRVNVVNILNYTYKDFLADYKNYVEYKESKLLFALYKKEFLSLDFIFRDNKLVSWTGSQYVDASTLETLLNAYFKKYGENFYILDSRRDGSFYTYYDKDGVIEIFAESYTDKKGRTYIKLNYREPFSPQEEKAFLENYSKEKNRIENDI